MKLSARDARDWIAKPPPDRPGTLIYGEDAMRVTLKRQELVANLAGAGAEEEMRIVRLQGGDLRREKAALADAIKAQGFFPGPRVALVEEATNQVAGPILAALEDWRAGDAHIVVTAGSLKPGTGLRKGFETHGQAACIAVYDDPPDRAEIDRWIAEAEIPAPDRDARAALSALAAEMGPGDFRQVLGKIGLYMRGQDGPTTEDDVVACAPASTEADLDDLLHAAADGQTARIAPIMSRLAAQGAQPVQISIAAMRHVRQLHQAASDPGGAGAGVAKLKPPVYGPRRDALLRQAQRFGRHDLEAAIGLLIETDLTLRSTARAPQLALVERMMIRLSMMGRR